MKTRLRPARPTPGRERLSPPRSPLDLRQRTYDFPPAPLLINDHAYMKVLRNYDPEGARGAGIEEEGAARWVGDVEQIPRYPKLEQAGLLIQIPVGKRRASLATVLQPPPIVAAGRKEGAIPSEAGSIGDYEE